MKIYCKTCHAELTPELNLLPESIAVNETDGEAYLPQGYYIISDGNHFAKTEGQILIHIHDLRNSTFHTDSKRLNGCCGLDGQDGPNRVCLNNHAIGTEHSDCWMPHLIALEADEVYMKEKINEEI